MRLDQIVNALQLSVLTHPIDLSEVEPTGGYASDLLSCVMSGAQRGNLWVTLQSHLNIVAVAALLDLAAIIITEGAQPDVATLEKAEQEGVILLSTPLPTYTVIGRLWELGVRNPETTP
ncbi:DRTGG domain-containing protein [uncultured Thermanaerothrix sp.]|uniref:DRTGG domain-containing protein n=1 Tax=uncultured Thermanaerothrix sp. TaxID=1195149 RepID=UPI002633CFFF|nr:DRTGG domain-containing protein [uncultured Thermanaerothrix sp.]